MQKNWLASLAIEHREARVIAEQERYGWLFNKKKCKKLIHLLTVRMSRIDKELRPSLPTHVRQYGVSVLEPFKMDGTLKKIVTDWEFGCLPEISGPFTRIFYEEMNLGSDKQLKEYLLSIGWKPTLWNYRKKDTINGKKGDRTGPKIQEEGKLCPNLEKIGGSLGQSLVLYLRCKHRLGLLTGLLSLIRDDGRISAEANTIGAATHRMTHKKIVNIPGADAWYGRHIRSLFTSKKGYSIVGCDSKGNQIRMLCHYMGDPEYTKQVLEGDIHTVHQHAAGLATRPQAKTFFYGFIFGAGDAKTGSIVGGSARHGKQLKDNFLARLPKLGTLVKRVKKKADTDGYIYGLDGRKVYINSSHKALNYLLQSAEAIYMKYAQCILWKWIRQERLDAHYVATIHDEFQLEVLDAHVPRVKELALKAMLKAGVHLGISIPMEGDVKVGKTWYSTH